MDGDKKKNAGAATRSDGRPDSSAWNQNELLSYKLAILSRLIERGSEAQLARNYGLWLTDCRLLGHLLAKSPRLVEKGMLTREADPADGRSAVFNLTAEGRKLATGIMNAARQGQGRFFNLLSPDESWILLDAVDKLLESVKRHAVKIADPKGE